MWSQKSFTWYSGKVKFFATGSGNENTTDLDKGKPLCSPCINTKYVSERKIWIHVYLTLDKALLPCYTWRNNAGGTPMGIVIRIR